MRHEIYLVPWAKYCIIRQWPSSKEHCDVINICFCAKHGAGMVRESKSLHSTATVWVNESNGNWSIVYSYISLRRPPTRLEHQYRKTMLINTIWWVAQCTVRSIKYLIIIICSWEIAIFHWHQIVPRAIFNGSGSWYCKIFINPVIFNRLAQKLLRPHRGYAQTYFDDIFDCNRAMNGRSDLI